MRKKAIETTKTWNTKDLAVGSKIEGIFIKVESVTGKFGETQKYVLEDTDHNFIGIFTSASLARQFKNIPLGSYVWVEYKGEQPTQNGRTVKVYEVEYDDQV